MNKNKIIFSILGGILLLGIVFLVMTLNSTKAPTPSNNTSKSGDINIWIYQDNVSKFEEFLSQFKEDIGKYSSKNIVVESFSDYETYKNTLSSAFLQAGGPDIFVLNNNDASFLENYIQGIDPNFISPNDFRKSYGGVFGDDLIITLEDDDKVEFLKGIPLGYQTLGVFYNRRYFKSEEFSTWTSLSSSLLEVTSKNSSIIPIAIGNPNMEYKSDIFAQMFLSFGKKSLLDIDRNTMTQVLQTFFMFGDRKGDNKYDTLTDAFDGLDMLDYFSRGDVVAVIGFPRMLAEIEKKGYQNNFLLATPIPQFVGKEKRTLVDYNYFVINKDTTQSEFINDLFAYMVSEDGVESYLEHFPYYLPASLEVEEDILEKKIYPEFNIVYKDFIDRESILSSFDLGDRSNFEQGLSLLLISPNQAVTLLESLKSKIVCQINKYNNFINLSVSCE